PSSASIPQLPPVQLVINKCHIHRQRSRQPRNKSQQRLPMRFTRGVKVQHSLSYPRKIKITWRNWRMECICRPDTTSSRCRVGPKSRKFGRSEAVPGYTPYPSLEVVRTSDCLKCRPYNRICRISFG